jgi:hypothetical protein
VETLKWGPQSSNRKTGRARSLEQSDRMAERGLVRRHDRVEKRDVCVNAVCVNAVCVNSVCVNAVYVNAVSVNAACENVVCV